MTSLRADLLPIVEEILARTKKGEAIELDAIGEAIGTKAIASDEIDAMLALIEKRGRKVVTRPGGSGEATLKTVLSIARLLRAELGRAPRPQEIAARAGLSEVDVQHALSLARIMQR